MTGWIEKTKSDEREAFGGFFSFFYTVRLGF